MASVNGSSMHANLVMFIAHTTDGGVDGSWRCIPKGSAMQLQYKRCIYRAICLPFPHPSPLFPLDISRESLITTTRGSCAATARLLFKYLCVSCFGSQTKYLDDRLQSSPRFRIRYLHLSIVDTIGIAATKTTMTPPSCTSTSSSPPCSAWDAAPAQQRKPCAA